MPTRRIRMALIARPALVSSRKPRAGFGSWSLDVRAVAGAFVPTVAAEALKAAFSSDAAMIR